MDRGHGLWLTSYNYLQYPQLQSLVFTCHASISTIHIRSTLVISTYC